MTTELQKSLESFLLSDSSIVGMIGDRLFRGRLPQNSTLPAIFYTPITEIPEYAQGGQELRELTVQVVCLGRTNVEAREVRTEVYRLLSGHRGAFGTIWAKAIFVESVSYDPLPNQFGGESPIPRETVNVRIHYS